MTETAVLSCGMLRLDLDRRLATYGDRTIGLPPTELLLLEALMRRQGQVIENSSLVADVWGRDVARSRPSATPLRNCVFKLRSRLEAAGCLDPAIQNRNRYGYGLLPSGCN